jgi:hypothetical protein
MDPIEPILPHPPAIPKVQPAARAAPVHRDRRGGGSPQQQHHRRGEREAVEVDVDGVQEPDEAEPPSLPGPGPVRLIDVTTGPVPGAPARRIDLNA